jgi:hypothetical protein
MARTSSSHATIRAATGDKLLTQEELLVEIHNQLVDLKRVLVEIELTRPGATEAVKTRLQEVLGSSQHIRADGSADGHSRQQRVIAPTDPDIKPGEGTDGSSGQ